MKKQNEDYVGDGLYAGYDGFALWLRAPRMRADGTPEDHVCALEPQVLAAFLRFAYAQGGHPRSVIFRFIRELGLNAIADNAEENAPPGGYDTTTERDMDLKGCPFCGYRHPPDGDCVS